MSYVRFEVGFVSVKPPELLRAVPVCILIPFILTCHISLSSGRNVWRDRQTPSRIYASIFAMCQLRIKILTQTLHRNLLNSSVTQKEIIVYKKIK